MRADTDDTPVARPEFQAATAAARLGLAQPPRRLTRARMRVACTAEVLWCRDLAFPSIRTMQEVLGYSSPSSVLNGFGHVDQLQAWIIGAEWRRIEWGWLSKPLRDRTAWLAEHAASLAAVDPVRLRLPGLVCSAVIGSCALLSPPQPGALVPLHSLAAFATSGRPGAATRLAASDVKALARAVARMEASLPPSLAVPA